MRIGLFFGSFNPIHVGHLIIAETMVSQTDLEQVWFVVSPQNPFKSRKSLIHEFDRLAMVEQAIHDNYHLRACDAEFHMPKPSYTVHTLAYLSERYPQHHFSLIAGEDNLRHFHKWKNYEVILEQHRVYVYPRPGAGPTELKGHRAVTMVNAPMLDISASFIRESIREGRSVRYLIPQEVEGYIAGKKLYGL